MGSFFGDFCGLFPFNSPWKAFLSRFEAPGANKTPNCRNYMINFRLFVW